MDRGPTVNLVSGRLVACYYDSCDLYEEGSWRHLQNTTVKRQFHSSATKENAILLIGGSESNTTEWIPVDGSPAQPGPFSVRHGEGHCTIQLSDNTLVVTGGAGTSMDFVTEYHLLDASETTLTPLGNRRYYHACAVYQDADNQQVS